MDRSDYWTTRKLLDSKVQEAREALDRAVRITKTRAQLLKEAEDERFEFVRAHKEILDSRQSRGTPSPPEA